MKLPLNKLEKRLVRDYETAFCSPLALFFGFSTFCSENFWNSKIQRTQLKYANTRHIPANN
jgi:hypothetical protein